MDLKLSNNNNIDFHKMNPFHLMDCDIEDAETFIKNWFAKSANIKNFFFTKSCTQSLEISLMILDFPQGSEIILPSYAFVSLANAINNLGLKCVFVDCEKETMNIDSKSIQRAITEKTKAIITINYNGVACDYDKIRNICDTNKLYLIEDNAHGIGATYKNKALGSIGDISTFSFDYLKTFSCFQGGGIAINNTSLLDKFYVASEFGTNRRACINGEVNFYEWIGKGTNSTIAKPLIEILYNQFKNANKILEKYNYLWSLYYNGLKKIEKESKIELPYIPEYATFQAHFFWIKTKDERERKSLIQFLKGYKIEAKSHYVPLHTANYGLKVGEFKGKDINTSNESDRLLRLPTYYNLDKKDIDFITQKIFQFYES